MKNQVIYFFLLIIGLSSCNETLIQVSEEKAVLKRIDTAFVSSDSSELLVQLFKLDEEVRVYNILALMMMYPYNQQWQEIYPSHKLANEGDFHGLYGYRSQLRTTCGFSEKEVESLKESNIIQALAKERNILLFLYNEEYTILSLEDTVVKSSKKRSIFEKRKGMKQALAEFNQEVKEENKRNQKLYREYAKEGMCTEALYRGDWAMQEQGRQKLIKEYSVTSQNVFVLGKAKSAKDFIVYN